MRGWRSWNTGRIFSSNKEQAPSINSVFFRAVVILDSIMGFLLYSVSRGAHSYSLSPSSLKREALGVRGASHWDNALLPRLSRLSPSKVSAFMDGSWMFWSVEHVSSSFKVCIFYLISSNKLGWGASGITSLRVTGVSNVKNIPWSSFSRFSLGLVAVVSSYC